MPGFFLALIAAFLATFGARDQRLAAQLAERLGAANGLLVMCWLSAAATAALAAFAGTLLAAMLPPAGKLMLVAFALLLGAAELAWPKLRAPPEEPTRSLFAIGAVLGSLQLGDGARFLIVAIAAATGAPYLAGCGGALGSGAGLTLGWAMGAGLLRWPLRGLRLGIAGMMLLAALWAGLTARGLI